MNENYNINYNAVVVRLGNPRKHSNADKLQCFNIFGNNIITDLSAKEGDLGIYFPLESALSQRFMYENNLFQDQERNKDQSKKGYFGNHGRVKAVTLRGEPSMGLWLPISCMSFVNDESVYRMNEGQEFTSWHTIEICKKYIPNPSKTQGSKINKVKGKSFKRKESRLVDGQFKFHFKTPQLGREIHKISPNDYVWISWKMHGTSAIAANILCKRRLTKIERIAKFFGSKIDDKYYDYIYSSRRVIQNDDIDKSFKSYYEGKLHEVVGKKFFEGKLNTGETVYYEIVGYTESGKYIQKDYDYGCTIPGECKIYVYRITQTGQDGVTKDLHYLQLLGRSEELGVSCVPHIFYGRAGSLFPIPEDENWNTRFLELLQKTYVRDQPSVFCNNNVPEEGIVVRKEELYIHSFKLKSFAFLKQESKQLDEGIIDIESQEDIEDEQNRDNSE